MRIKQLEIFIAVVDEGSFAKAAEKMNITVPAVTKSMASMEVEAGALLFDKSGYRVQPNEAGRGLLKYARVIVSDFKEALRYTQRISSNQAHRLNVYAGPAIIRELLPVVSCDFETRYPDVQIVESGTFRVDDRLLVFDQIRNGDIDLALCPIRLDTDTRGLQWEPLLRMHLQLVVHNTHPLTEIENITFSHLLPYTWIVPSTLNFVYKEIEKMLFEFGVNSPDSVKKRPVLARESVLKMLKLQPFVAVLPHNDKIYALDTSEFTIIDIDVSKFGWTVFAITRETRVHNDHITHYIEATKRIIQSGSSII